ncbi:MAG TPA: hypothetical protein VLB12_17025 [Gemmatimonadales bacterium]|nr:hypothetical protein [Gemmatimonadales bacterium]
MSDFGVAAIAWIALGLHIGVGVVALRNGRPRPLVPILNLTSALCVLAYWGHRWWGYLFRGVTWYASDQLIPLYALLVCVLALVTLSGRHPAVALNWIVFLFHTVVLVAAVLFLKFFRLNRLF